MKAAIMKMTKNNRENDGLSMREKLTGTARPEKWAARFGLVLVFLTGIFVYHGLFAVIQTEAATLTKTYSFSTTSESWTGNGGTSTTDTFRSAAGNPSGSLESSIVGKNQTNANAGWLITGITWETLGLPAGSTITSVDGYYDWSCTAFTTGNAASASGDLVITDSADGNATTLETGLTFNAVTAWAVRNAAGTVAMPAALQTSSTSIKVKLLGNLQTANNAAAVVTRQMDNVVLVITYNPADSTPPAVGTVTPANGVSGNFVDGSFDIAATLTDNESAVSGCQYCASSDGACDTEWAAGTLSGASPAWTCTKTGITGFANNTTLTLNIRGTSSGGTGTGTAITKTVDTVGPAAGASFSATPGNNSCSLSWAAATDAGGGMDATSPYEVRRDSTSCTTGTQVYIGTGTSAADNAVLNGTTYDYRLCYKDVFGYQSEYPSTIACTPVSGPPTLNPDTITGGTWTNEAGGALTPDRINDVSDATYAMTATDLATFNTTFSNDAAYSGKQIDNVRIYIRAYTATNEFIDWGPVIGGTPYLSGTAVTLTTTITDYFKDWATNPAGGNWTSANVDALEAQIRATRNGGGAMGQENVYKVWAVITYSDPPSSGNLVHNSVTTGSTKWGGWGVAGKRYGEITCETCHTPATTNIKRIKTAITSPDSPTNNFPGGGTVTATDTRPGTSDYGDDSTGHATSTKVCEICHTYDNTRANGVQWHAYNMSAGGADLTHQNNADCVSCHKHNKGFKASCDTCHGGPPTVSTAGGPDGLADNNGATPGGTTGSTTPGAHASHVTTSSIACVSCHYGSSGSGATHNNGDLNITMGFFAFGGAAQGGAYDGQATANYNATTTTPATTTSNLGSMTCSTVYCHGSTINFVANPIWTGPVNCGDCHKATNADPPILGAHQRHAESGTYGVGPKQGLNILCTDCHGPAAGAQGHVDGDVSWTLSTTNARFKTTVPYATYSGSNAGSSGGLAPSGTYGSCNNTYCHSTVTADGGGAGTYVASPAWNSTTTCASCHVNQTAGFTGKHQKHAAGTYTYACATCHTNAGSETVKHADRNVDVMLSATYGGSYSGSLTPGDAYGSCSSVYCHSSGEATPSAFKNPAWNGAALDCKGCHNYTVASTVPMTTGNHPEHINNAATYVTVYGCQECHSSTTSDGTTITTPANHVNQAREVSGAKIGSYASPTCSNVYCHSSGQATPTYRTVPAWGNTTDMTCDSCHGTEGGTTAGEPAYANGTNPTGVENNDNSHPAHVGSALDCAVCHVDTVTAAGTAIKAASTLHINQTRNVNFTAAYDTGGGTNSDNYNTGTKVCSNISCHGAGAPMWGGASLACNACHSASSILAGKHAKHYGTTTVATDRTDARTASGTAYIYNCGVCHYATSHGTGDVTPGVQAANVSFGANNAISGTYTAGAYVGTDAGMEWTNGTCTVTYCHSQGQSTTSPFGGEGNTGATWNGAAMTCQGCHNFDAAAALKMATGKHTAHMNDGTIMPNAACSACHTTTTSDSTTITNEDLHVNKVKDVTIAATYDSDATPNNNWASSQCSNVYCHSDGQAAPTYKNILWTATISDCKSCHNYDVASGAPMATGSHPEHVNNDAVIAVNYGCQECHTGTTSNGTSITTPASHVNKARDVSGAKIGSYASPTCSNVYCHSSGQATPTYRTVLAWGNTTNLTCDGCHGTEGGTTAGEPAYANGANPTTVENNDNSHTLHVTVAADCTKCHTDTVTAAGTAIKAGSTLHTNQARNINFAAAYDNNAGTNSDNYNAGTKTCSSTSCHGTNSKMWGNNTTNSQCVKCHGVAGTTPAGYTGDTRLAAPGASNNTGVDTSNSTGAVTRGVSNDTEVGAHYGHLYAQSGISSPIACSECHAVPAVTQAGIYGHLDGGNADFTWGTIATKGGTMTPAFDAGTHTCSNNRCHNVASNNHTANPTDTTPTWNDTAYFGDVTSPLTATECNRCHFYSSTINCNGCHGHAASATPTVSFTDATLHVNGTVESSGGTCIGCHAAIKGTRRAVVGEFGLTYGHKKTGRGAVTDADCYPCHYEANQNGTVNTTYHSASAGDGVIDLRGNTGVIAVTAFSRDLSSNALEAAATNVQTHCLACHDGTAPAWVAGGSSTNPFGTGQVPVDVATQLAATNTSFHPVLGVQNNSWAVGTVNMQPPWNTNTHYKITCFDCHSAENATGTIAMTPASHGSKSVATGGTGHLRGAVTGQGNVATPLCTKCHTSTVYWGTKVHNDTNTTSAMRGIASNRHNASAHYGCTECHGTGGNPGFGAVATQANRAIDAHGFNAAGRFLFIRTNFVHAPATKECITNMCGTGYVPQVYTGSF